MTDTYDADLLRFVSANPAPDGVSTSGTAPNSIGTITWDDLGPIFPGGTSSVFLTFEVLEPPNNATTTVTNVAFVIDATFSNGVPANTATDSVESVLSPAGAIGDFVWRDLDEDGVQDGTNETGIGGVTVVLMPPAGVDAGNGAGNPVTNVTDASGFYLFDGLPASGSYTVTVVTATLPGGAGTNTYDEDDGTNSPNSQTAVVLDHAATNGSDTHLTADFGYQVQSTIEGTIWHDLNRDGDGTPDTGEDWLTNVTVYLFQGTTAGDPSTAIATNQTDANGYFQFVGNYTGDFVVVAATNTGPMATGDWTHSFDTDGTNSADQVQVNVVAGGSDRADFSYYLDGTYTVGDTLFYDWDGNGVQATNEEGIALTTVRLYEDANTNGVVDAGDDAFIASTVTTTNGYYAFPDLPPGNYLVVVDEGDTNFPPLYDNTADPDGGFDGRSVVVVVDTNRLDQDFGYQPLGSGSIGDTVWFDVNGDGAQVGPGEVGLSNITVTLLVDLNGDGTYVAIDTAETDADGNYLFSDLPDGDYRVSVSTDDIDLPTDPFGNPYAPTTPTGVDATITDGNSYLDADFGFAVLGAIGDTVFWDANRNGTEDFTEDGISNITVSLYLDVNGNGAYDAGTDTLVESQFTDGDGKYLFAGLATGDYVVVVSETGVLATALCTADPDADGDPTGPGRDGEYGLSVGVGTSFMGADFGYVPPGVLGDTVWFDFNQDGVQGPLESGIPYITIELYTNGTLVATNETDPEGHYLFSNLPDATYRVVVKTNDTDWPGDLIQVYDPDAVLDDQGSSIVMSNGNVVSIGGVPCTTNCDLDIDFGYDLFGTNLLSGTVGLDGTPYDGVMGTNDTGVSSNEAPFPGTTVYLYLWDDDGDGIVEPGETLLVDTTITAGNGDYAFAGLPAGDGNDRYIVALSAPEDDLKLTTTNGATPATDVVETVNAQGNTVSAYQVLNIVPVTTNVDFAFRFTKDFDFGDLPQSYSTRLEGSPSGARHVVPAAPDLFLGLVVDTESNGAPSADATGDGGDEDGVTPIGVWEDGTDGGSVEIVVGAGSGWLVGYIDFNDDGDFSDVGELVVDQAATPGTYTNSFDVPTNTISTTNATQLYARFRIFESEPAFSALAFAGSADNGEVEDYVLSIGGIGDLVWLDQDGDGVKDASELPLAGVRVFVDLSGDGIYQAGEPTDVTDTNGVYGIFSLAGGVYSVLVDSSTLPAGLEPTFDLDGVGTLNKAVVVLANGQVRTDVDFGYRGSAAIGNYVWVDENSDGVQDAGEAGIPNVVVELYDTNGTLVASTVTDANGEYLFAGVLPGTYTVRVDTATMAAGLATNQTYDLDGTLDDETSVTVAAADERLDADFGYNWASTPDVDNGTGTGAIGDRVWIDANGDGVQDAGEAGLSNTTVRLYADYDGDGSYTDLVSTATTDAAGMYIFDGLTGSAYVVEVNGGSAPSGYTQTGDPDGLLDSATTFPIVLGPGDVYLNADFGYQPATSYTIGDTIYFDSNGDGTNNASDYGIAGVTVALVSDTNGNGAWDAGEPVIATDITDSSGLYAFPGLPNGDYLVQVTDTRNVLGELAQTGDPDAVLDSMSAVTLAGADNLDQDFGYAPSGHTAASGLVGDTVFLDRDESGTPGTGEGLEGVTVRLYDTGGVAIATTVTDENGNYSFGFLNGGTYTVRVDIATLPAGVTNTVDPDGGVVNESSVTIAGGGINLLQDFGYRDTVDANTISGTLWSDSDADGTLEAGETNRFAGVTVVLYDTNGNAVASTTTDANGDYSFTGLPDGTYAVDVTDDGNGLNGYWHSDGPNDGSDNNSQDDPYTVSVAGGQTNTTGDFGYYVEGGALGNRVWWDGNDNGVQDEPETNRPGITNVLITLEVVYPGGATVTVYTVTDTNGYYSFGTLLLDEDYNGDGSGPEPAYTISSATPPGATVTVINATNDMYDADDPSGVSAQPVQGVLDVGGRADPGNETVQASYDFGFDPQPTLVVISGFRAFTRDDEVIVEWQTSFELGTIGFFLQRESGPGNWVQINQWLLPARTLFGDPPPNLYEVADGGVVSGGTYTWRIIEVDNLGRELIYGPYTVVVDGLGHTYEGWAEVAFAGNSADASQGADPDDDGLTNFEEYLAGTDPLAANSTLALTGIEWREAAGEVVLHWDSVSNRNYAVEISIDLAEGFLPFASGVAGTPPENVHTAQVDVVGSPVYFRVILD